MIEDEGCGGSTYSQANQASIPQGRQHWAEGYGGVLRATTVLAAQF